MTVSKWLDPILNAKDKESLFEIASDELKKIDFDKYYWGISDKGVTSFPVNTWPKEWLKEYQREGYQNIDPVILRILNSNIPFFWHEVTDYGMTRQQEQIFKRAASHGIKYGFNMPYRGVTNEFICLGLYDDSEEFYKKVKYHKKNLQGLVIAVLTQAIELSIFKEDKALLSPRQREVLLYAARGKTNEEIGMILSITKDTVADHLKVCGQKLGVAGKMNIVARAASLGIVVI